MNLVKEKVYELKEQLPFTFKGITIDNIEVIDNDVKIFESTGHSETIPIEIFILMFPL